MLPRASRTKRKRPWALYSPKTSLPGLNSNPKDFHSIGFTIAETAWGAMSPFELGRGGIRRSSTGSFDAHDRIVDFFGGKQRYEGINDQIRQKIDTVPHVQ
jgi:hypothetical protein